MYGMRCGWWIDHCNSSAEEKILDDLLHCKDTELVHKWMCTWFKRCVRRMAKRTLHPPLEHSLSEEMLVNSLDFILLSRMDLPFCN